MLVLSFRVHEITQGFNTQISGPPSPEFVIQHIWGEVRESASLRSSPGDSDTHVQGPQAEIHWVTGRHQLEVWGSPTWKTVVQLHTLQG